MPWRILRRGLEHQLGPPEAVESSQLAALYILRVPVDSALSAVVSEQPTDPAARSANRIIVMLRNRLTLSLPSARCAGGTAKSSKNDPPGASGRKPGNNPGPTAPAGRFTKPGSADRPAGRTARRRPGVSWADPPA
jgi:hypothetical protein